MVVPFVSTLIAGRSTRHSFLVGLVSAGGLWSGMAAFLHWGPSELIVARVADMMSAPGGVSLILVAGIIAGLAGGVAGATGYTTRQAFQNQD